MIAKLRLSAHNLQIEMGRRSRIDRHLRICICNENVEDELHFLRWCSIYQDIRIRHDVNMQSISDLLNDKKYVLYIEAMIEELWKRRKSVRV